MGLFLMNKTILILLYTLGIIIYILSFWLIWDWHNSYWYFLNHEKWYKYWSFPLPFKIYVFTPETHTVAFDLAFSLSLISIIIISLTSYLLGRNSKGA